jgi:hypothetical protein
MSIATARTTLVAGLALTAALAVDAARNPAATTVARLLGNNKLGIMPAELATKPNPMGQGTLVFVKRTRFGAAQRHHVWLVMGNRVIALTADAESLTPSLLAPREIPEAEWKKTGLSLKDPGEAVRIAYGQ